MYKINTTGTKIVKLGSDKKGSDKKGLDKKNDVY